MTESTAAPLPIHQDLGFVLHVLGSVKNEVEKINWIKILGLAEQVGEGPVGAALGQNAVLGGMFAGFLKGLLVAHQPAATAAVVTVTPIILPASNLEAGGAVPPTEGVSVPEAV